MGYLYMHLKFYDLSLRFYSVSLRKVITRPSFQEETGIVLGLVFPSSSNRSVVFKRMPVLVYYHVIDFRQIHRLRGKITLTCCREQKAVFLSVR